MLPGKILKSLLAGLLLLVVSCLPDPLEVGSVPGAKPEIVVSSQITSDQSLMVFLTRTFGALDANDEKSPQELLSLIAIQDALVIIEGPGGRDTLHLLGNGLYGGDLIPPFKSGERYNLYINSPEFGTVYATTEVKPKVAFDSVEAELSNNGLDDSLAQINFTFQDTPEDNWYMINVQEIQQGDPIEDMLNPKAFTILVPDDDFNGKSYSEGFKVFPRDNKRGDSIAVSLSNISEEYYRFMKLRVDNRFNLIEFLSEPVNYPSNIVGGKGYFNLYVPDVRYFVLR